MEDREMTIDDVELSAEEKARIDKAIPNARDPYDYEVAVSAEYDTHHDLVIIKLKTGQRLAIPREDLQELADADPEKVSKVEIEMLRMRLHWEELNVDFRVDGLRQGFYGFERWMKQLEQRRLKHSVDALSLTA